MKKLIFGTTAESSFASEFTMTLLRVYTGLAMAFGHGLGKLPPSEQFVAGVVDLGFPLPEVFAWAAGLSEFVGGLFLALGLLTRPSALCIAGTMVVAGFIRHAQDPFRMKELALMYLVVALMFAARGAGRWSVDRFIGR